MIRRKKQYKYVIDITSIENRLEIITTISKPPNFKTAHENVSCTTYLFIIFVVKYKESFFGGSVKQITKHHALGC